MFTVNLEIYLSDVSCKFGAWLILVGDVLLYLQVFYDKVYEIKERKKYKHKMNALRTNFWKSIF